MELHDVSSEGPRLVAEDILDHAKLLVQVGRARLRRRVGRRMVHLTIHRYEFCL